MKTKSIISMIMGFVLLTSTSYAQKVYINKDWEDATGTVGAIQRTASAIDNNKNLIVVSNTINVSNNTDVLITKYNPEGTILWQQTFDGSGHGNDYGVQLKINNSNEIFVVAALQESTNLDFGVLKYSPNGNLIWGNTWNGSANGIDIPADIGVDTNGDVYLVGGTESTNSFSDYAIVKFDADGDYLWHTTYDYANLHDAATSISFSGNRLVVSGASASALTNWDYATLLVNKEDGGILDTKRTSVPGVGLDNVVAVTTDNNNNTYITGYVEENGNRNIQTLKINSDFELEWVKNFDGGLEDVGKAIGVDDFGNVYVVGTKKNANGGKDYITIKYDLNGTELWSREFGSGGGEINATAEHLSITNTGDILITGTLDNEGNKEFATIKYQSSGDLEFVQKYDAGNHNNESKSIVVNDDAIYVTGLVEKNGEIKNATVKYSEGRRIVEPRIIDGIESHVKHEIIVRFDVSVMNIDAVDKNGFNFGLLSDFVQPSVISQLENVYPNVAWKRVSAYKIFKHFTSSDTTFINRLGDEVEIAPFWAILLINVGKENEVDVCNALNADQIMFPTIKYAQTNGIIVPTTDDPKYSLQESLMSTNHPDGHINIEPAWAIETGSDKIKIGVLDTGIKWDHEDFGGFFNGSASKIKGGYDYQIDQSLQYTANHGDPITQGIENGHGTKVAGIIGALRNNTMGISGIAGGNWPYANVIPGDGTQPDPNPAEHNIGVSIHGFRAVTIGLSAAEVTAAMLDASTWTALYPESMDIINNSWVRTVPYLDEIPQTWDLFKDAQRQIFRNGVINVCSRGNFGDSKSRYPQYAEREEWVISVGGSNKDGYKHSSSSFGDDVDLIAPYDVDIVYTIGNNSTNEYTSFSGTSAAAPHVAGVAGLMLSHIDHQPSTPNNLAPDDIEFLLQRYARDIVPDLNHQEYEIGYDDLSGWGLLDAGAVMEKIDRTQYIVKHIKKEVVVPTNLSSVPHITGDLFFSNYEKPFGKYYGTMYELSYTLQNNLNQGDVILDSWPLNSYTTLLDNTINPQPTFVNIENANYITNMNNTSGDIRGTIVHLTKDKNGNSIDYWYPASPGALVRVGYTLHLQSAYAGVNEEGNHAFNLSCYPNPSTDDVTISFSLPDYAQVQIEAYDINGRLVYSSEKTDYSAGQNLVTISSNNWTKGMYFLNLKANETAQTIKFIKQ